MNTQYFVLDHACRCLYFYDISDFCTDQCLSKRRLVGNLILKAACLGRTNQFILFLFVILYVQYTYQTANTDLVKIDLLIQNNLCILEDLFDLLNTSLNITLLVFCCIILSVL